MVITEPLVGLLQFLLIVFIQRPKLLRFGIAEIHVAGHEQLLVRFDFLDQDLRIRIG